MSAVAAIIWKDLVLELRTREVLTSTALFALLVALTFSFALDLRLDAAREVVPGAFWVTLILSALLALNRTLAAEREGATIEGLRMAPVDRGSIFAAKFFVNLLFMLWIALISAVAFSVFFNIGFEWGWIGNRRRAGFYRSLRRRDDFCLRWRRAPAPARLSCRP